MLLFDRGILNNSKNVMKFYFTSSFLAFSFVALFWSFPYFEYYSRSNIVARLITHLPMTSMSHAWGHLLIIRIIWGSFYLWRHPSHRQFALQPVVSAVWVWGFGSAVWGFFHNDSNAASRFFNIDSITDSIMRLTWGFAISAVWGSFTQLSLY